MGGSMPEEITMQLISAAKNGQIETVKSLLKIPSIDVNAVNEDGYTALIVAAANGQIEIVERLLVAPGIDVNHAGQYGNTALISAAVNGQIEIVGRLLAAGGIVVNHASQNGNTALTLAVDRGYTEIVKRLLAAPDIEINVASEDDNTALILAAKNGQAGVVEHLMRSGANVYLKSVSGNTAITIAASLGHVSVLEVFNGFRVSLDDDRLLRKREDGSIETLAQTAAWNQKPEVIDFLIKANINIHPVFPPIGYWVNNRDGYAFDNDSRQTLVALLSDVSPMGRFNGNDARTQLFKDIEAFRERVFLLSSWFRPYVWQHASDPEAKRFDILMNLFVQTPCSVVMIKEGLSLPVFFNMSFVGALVGRHTELIKEDYEERILDTIVAGCLQRYRDKLDIKGLLWCTEHKDAWRAKRHDLKSWLREVQNGVNFESNGPAADASGQPAAKRQRVDAGAVVSAELKQVAEVLTKALNPSISTPGYRQEAIDLLCDKAPLFMPGELAAIINIGDSRWSASKSGRRIPSEMYDKTRLPNPSGPRFFASSQHEQLVTFFRNEGLGRPDDLPVEVQGEMLKRFSYNPDGL